MPSKTFFSESFHPALFRKNLTRFIPLWVWYLIVLVVIFPLSLLFLGLSAKIPFTALDAQAHLYSMLTAFGPALSAAIGLCSAMAVFSYLFTARSIGMVHALPIRRSGLFLTNYLSGLLFPIAANTVTAILVFLVQLALGIFSFAPVGMLWLCLNGMLLFFFSFAAFCAMFTGQILALPVFYAILNVLVAGLCALITAFIEEFQFGMSGFFLSGFAFSPILKLYSRFRSWSEVEFVNLGDVTGTSTVSSSLSGQQWIWIYAAVGILFAVLAYLVYRRRTSESAGDLVTFRWAAVLFRFGVGICAGLALGYAAYYLFYYQLLGNYQHNLFILTFCIILLGLIGYFSAAMLLKKSIHVLRSSWKGAILMIALSILLTTSLATDPLHLAGRVPSEDGVTQAEVRISSLNFTTDDPALISQLFEIHRAISQDIGEIESAYREKFDNKFNMSSREDDTFWCSLYIRYVYDDGSTFSRDLPIILPLNEDPASDSYAAQIFDFFDSEAVREAAISQLESMQVSDVYISTANNGTYIDSQATMLDLRDAVVTDLRDGRLSLLDNVLGIDSNLYVEISGYLGPDDYTNYVYYCFSVPEGQTAIARAVADLSPEELGAGSSTEEVSDVDYTITESGVINTAEDETAVLYWNNACLQLPSGSFLLNSALENDSDTLEAQHDDYYQQAIDAYTNSVANGYADTFQPFGVTRTVHPMRMDDQVISVWYEDVINTGGPHPGTVNTCRTYLCADGTLMSLETLSPDPDALRSAVTDYLTEWTSQSQYDGMFFDGYEASLSQALDDGRWYLGIEGLCVTFDPGVIAPNVGGTQSFVVPYAELGDLIYPEWLP